LVRVTRRVGGCLTRDSRGYAAALPNGLSQPPGVGKPTRGPLNRPSAPPQRPRGSAPQTAQPKGPKHDRPNPMAFSSPESRPQARRTECTGSTGMWPCSRKLLHPLEPSQNQNHRLNCPASLREPPVQSLTVSRPLNPLFRVLCTFRSRYFCAIGPWVQYLALDGFYHPFSLHSQADLL